MDNATKLMVLTALRTIGAPAAGAVAVLLAARLGPGRRRRDLPWVAGLAMAAGVVAAHLAIAGVPAIPPVEVVGWLPIAVSAAALLGVAADRFALRCGPVAALTGALLALVAWRVTLPVETSVAGVVAATAVLLGVWLAAETAARGPGRSSVFGALLVLATGASLVTAFSFSSRYAMLFGGITAAVASVGFWRLLFWRELPPGRGMAMVGATAIGTLMLLVHVYVEPPLAAEVLLLAGVGAIALLRLPALAGRAGWPGLAIGAAVPLVPVAIAVVVAWMNYGAVESELHRGLGN